MVGSDEVSGSLDGAAEHHAEDHPEDLRRRDVDDDDVEKNENVSK